MRINCNVSSIIAQTALNSNETRLSKSIQRLSSGLKINRAEDDSAGMAISLKMNAQIKCLERATQNANDGVSVVNTADGAMTEMHDILQRMNELAIQSANGTNADSDREQIQLEIDQLVQELDRISSTTEFNGQTLLDGTFAYKGYTNTENVKVKSYSDGVQSGYYGISTITYSKYEDTIMDFTAYIDDDKNNGDTTFATTYTIEDADDVRENLIYEDELAATNVTSTSINRAFPAGSKVLVDGDEITIKANNDFEIKLTVNDALEKTVTDVTTTTTSTPSTKIIDTYENVVVKTADGTAKYNISEVIFEEETSPTQGAREVEMTEAQLETMAEDLRDAFENEWEDGKDYTIADVEYDSTAGKFTLTVDYTDANGTAQTDTIDFDVALTYTISVEEEVLTTEGTTETVTKSIEVDFSDTANRTLYSEQYDKLQLSEKIVGSATTTGDPINKYLTSHVEREETVYTVGSDTDPIILDMTGLGAMVVQIGANEGQTLEMEIPALSAYYLGVDGLDITTEDKATAAIDTIGDAIDFLSGVRAKIGAYTNRLEHTITNLDSTVENMTAAYSRIMDADMATEMTEYSTVQVLVESSTAMLAQANERPQQVLQLIQS